VFIDAVRKEHDDDVVNQSDPPVPAGIVGDLLINETSRECGPRIQVSGVPDADLLETLPSGVESADCRGVGLG
jgi:hypothetical protein